MPKLNRGKTNKLSIRLSTGANEQIEIAAKNLGISKSGTILFGLTKLLKNPPTLSKIEQLKKEITLEPYHFVLTANEGLLKRVNKLAEDYEIKKNVLIGYIVSEYFKNMSEPIKENVKSKQFMVQLNENLKKKMIEYSEEHYIPLSALVSYSILHGPYEGIPKYEEEETVQFFTNVPGYIGEMVKEHAEKYNIREHFYTSLCLYK
ncbi:hypothetical protein [Neobacillus drentensis]|uniref:hypothetical protein n=1 Tax=Neobacillus drentensis TaxID=220684 RepID=UPI000825E9CA|nr:hypothetical protein [Neobacillus drentensis]